MSSGVDEAGHDRDVSKIEVAGSFLRLPHPGNPTILDGHTTIRDRFSFDRKDEPSRQSQRRRFHSRTWITDGKDGEQPNSVQFNECKVSSESDSLELERKFRLPVSLPRYNNAIKQIEAIALGATTQ